MHAALPTRLGVRLCEEPYNGRVALRAGNVNRRDSVTVAARRVGPAGKQEVRCVDSARQCREVERSATCARVSDERYSLSMKHGVRQPRYRGTEQ